jgi:hypothetical protein
MLATAFAPQLSLRRSSRVPAISQGAAISAIEIACLMACGALAACAVGFLHLSLRVPGHAILRGVLPMAAGFALVPRRLAGTVMAIGAGMVSAVLSMAHMGSFPLPAMLSVLALGPVLDVAILGRPTGWQLYARFVMAGIGANLFALAFKLAGFQLGMQMVGGGEGFARFSVATLATSYLLCGAVAGFLGAAACFRARGGDDLRRD